MTPGNGVAKGALPVGYVNGRRAQCVERTLESQAPGPELTPAPGPPRARSRAVVHQAAGRFHDRIDVLSSQREPWPAFAGSAGEQLDRRHVGEVCQGAAVQRVLAWARREAGRDTRALRAGATAPGSWSIQKAADRPKVSRPPRRRRTRDAPGCPVPGACAAHQSWRRQAQESNDFAQCPGQAPGQRSSARVPGFATMRGDEGDAIGVVSAAGSRRLHG